MPNRGYTYREQVGPRDAGRTVLEYLARRYTHTSEAEWQARLDTGEVELDGRRATAGDRLRPGASLVWHRPPWEEPEVPLHFELVHEDAELVAVSKPSGLPTMPAGGFLEHTLMALVQQQWPEASPMHRLGRGTSGLVLFARTPLARARMQQSWRSHEVRKVYRALASGVLAQPQFTIDAPIGLIHHPKLGELFAATPDGKDATSHVTVREQRASESLVDVLIDTGRPHQIRIHLASVGHPLVGDPLYTAGGQPKQDALPGDLGYLLHAMELRFVHPATGAELTLTNQPPAALRTSDAVS